MAADQGWLNVQGAVDELLRRDGAPPGQAGSGGTHYGQLYAPPARDMGELRRQQAEFARAAADLDRRNSWMAIPALAPALAVLGAEASAILAARGAAAGAGAANRPLTLLEREPWLRNSRQGDPLSEAAKTAIREKDRIRVARANGMPASKMRAEVHHSDPLEWAHIKPNADPSRLANLAVLRKEAHVIATREWATFKRSLEGRLPTQAELMAAKLRIDRMVEQYVLRPGLPRSNKPPGKGGPR